MRAHVAWQYPAESDPAPEMFTDFLEYQMLGALHLAVKYAEWAGGHGDADILARTTGNAKVRRYRRINRAGGPPPVVTRTSDEPTQFTIPLDTLSNDPRAMQLAARSIAADLLADYGQPETSLLKDDGTIADELVDAEYQPPLRAWKAQSGMIA